jgi:hypothetical protein
MRSTIFALCALATMVTTTDVSANADFDYERTQTLYAVTQSEAIVYAKFPGFLEFRRIIVDKMRFADEATDGSSPLLYTLRLVGIGEETTLYVGKSWIGNGERTAELDESEFQYIEDAIKRRRGQGYRLDLVEPWIRRELVVQQDPAWQPRP